MVPKFLLLAFSILFTSFAASSSFLQGHEAVGVSGLNPKKDPTYDPKTGHWGWDFSKDPVYDPTSQVNAYSPWSFNSDENSFSPYSNISPSPRSLISPMSDLFSLSPSTTKEDVSALTTLNELETIELAYIPKRCRGQKPLWHVKIGNIYDKYTPTAGLISSLGYFKELINEISIPSLDITYSIISHMFADHESLTEALSCSVHLDLYYIKRKDALEALINLGMILDEKLSVKHVMAITLSFVANGPAHIEIIFDSSKLISAHIVRDELLQFFPKIGNFRFNIESSKQK